MKLKDLLAEPLSNGRSVPSLGGGFPVLRLTALGDQSVDLTRRKEGAWTLAEASGYLVQSGDFMVARGNGSLARVGWGALVPPAPDPVAFPDTMIRVRLDAALVDSDFFALQWNAPTVRRQLEQRARTTAGIYKVNQADLREIDIKVPSLHEQRRVVDMVNEYLTRVRRASDTLVNSLALGRQLVASVLSGATVGQKMSLADVAQIQGGIAKSQRRRPHKSPSPYLRVANVTADGMDLSDVHEIELFEGELDRFRLQRGDLLVVEGNGSPTQIGRAALWDNAIADCVHQNHLIRVRPDDCILPEFLEVAWNSPSTRRRLTEVASSTSGLYTLSVSKLASLPITVPELSVQRGVVEAVRDAREVNSRIREQVQVAEARAAALRSSILTAAFSGRL